MSYKAAYLPVFLDMKDPHELLLIPHSKVVSVNLTDGNVLFEGRYGDPTSGHLDFSTHKEMRKEFGFLED